MTENIVLHPWSHNDRHPERTEQIAEFPRRHSPREVRGERLALLLLILRKLSNPCSCKHTSISFQCPSALLRRIGAHCIFAELRERVAIHFVVCAHVSLRSQCILRSLQLGSSSHSGIRSGSSCRRASIRSECVDLHRIVPERTDGDRSGSLNRHSNSKRRSFHKTTGRQVKRTERSRAEHF